MHSIYKHTPKKEIMCHIDDSSFIKFLFFRDSVLFSSSNLFLNTLPICNFNISTLDVFKSCLISLLSSANLIGWPFALFQTCSSRWILLSLITKLWSSKLWNTVSRTKWKDRVSLRRTGVCTENTCFQELDKFY